MTSSRRVLLIDPPYLGDNIHWWDRVGSHMPGLGLPTLAAWLERAGHEVAIVDGHAEGLSLARPEAALTRLGRPDWIGITAMTPVVPQALSLVRSCRRLFPDTPIVLGGAHATVLPEDLLRHREIDCAVRGEGERTLEELVEGRPFAEIQGLSWRRGGQVVHNPDRPLLEDLDQLPSPAWRLLPMDRYRPGLGTYRQLPAMSLMSGRGCPNACTYCFNIFGRRVRRQSPERVIAEIERLSRDYGVRQIQFYDDTFTLQRPWLEAFCEGLLSRLPQVSWTCYGRVDRVDRESLALMARAGCHQICFGVESGDPEVLGTIDKRIGPVQVRRAVSLARRAGIEPRGTFMFGNQGETEASMRRTLDLALELDLDVALFSVATAYPGTAFHRWARDEGHLVTDDWSHYDRNSTTVRLPTVAPETVWDFHTRAYRGFYLRPRFIARRGLRLRNLRHIADAARVLTAVRTWR
jgi:anaerobic magnesium-protoporphyrin IX monomethyl ester cyclase